MTTADVAVISVAVLALAGLGWFFFGPRRARSARLGGGVQRAVVKVRGGYSPEVIRLRQGVPAELVFDRQESSDCTSNQSSAWSCGPRSPPCPCQAPASWSP